MKIPQVERWECVRVEWVDSCGPKHGWHKAAKKEQQVAHCVSGGLVFAQDAECLSLVLSRDTDSKAIDGIITIPNVAITAFEHLSA